MDGNDVLRKIGLFIGVAACGALAVSCGGGGDSSEPTPTPTDTSATPTPTPTTATVFDLVSAFDVLTNNANIAFAYFTPTGGAETFNDASRVNGQSRATLAFVPESASFRFADTDTATTFAAADLVSASATQRVYANGARRLTYEVPFDHSLRATYEVANQPFTRNSVAGTLRSNRVSLFFNTVTTTAAIASTLSYTGTAQAAGGQPGVTPPGAITASPTTFSVSAGSTNTITGTIVLQQTVGGVTTTVGTIAVNAPVTASAFAGTIDDTASGLKGSYAGTLAGPNREEVVLLFALANTDSTREYVGTFIGD